MTIESAVALDANTDTSLSPVIQFQSTVKNYGHKKIGPIDLDIKRGDIVGFLGPNGSGKTTCIRLILGLIRPSTGRVYVNGVNPISKHASALRRVAYSPELPNLQSFLTPHELLSLVTHELGISSSARESEIERVLELAGIQEYANTKIGKLSKGMIQRLSVAQAILGSPEILILDEPMIGLDPAGSAHFRELFRKFARENNGTVFMSSHIMSEVESLCTSVAIIHSGKMLFQGDVNRVIQKVLDYSIIILEAKGITEATLDRIRNIQGVADIIPDGASFEIIVRGADEDIRPVISKLVIDSGAKLHTIKRGDNLLERAYIEAISSSNQIEEV